MLYDAVWHTLSGPNTPTVYIPQFSGMYYYTPRAADIPENCKSASFHASESIMQGLIMNPAMRLASSVSELKMNIIPDTLIPG